MASTGRKTGRPAQPLERHLARGNPSRKDLVAPLPGRGLAALGAADELAFPEALNETGKVLWTEIWAGARSWLNPQLDRFAVESLCWDYQRLVALRSEIDAGEIPMWTANEAGRLFKHPAFGEVTSLEARVTSWSAQLGLNPSDRSRLGLTMVRVRDELDELNDRRAHRQELQDRQRSERGNVSDA